MGNRIHKAVLSACLLVGIPAYAQEAIPVAAIFALTGRGASSNVRHLRGAEMAVDEINQAGGVLGRPIELVILDNESTDIGSAKAAKEAVERGVTAIIGSSWSSHSLAIAPIAQEARIPMITNYSTNPEVTRVGNYIFRVCYIDTFQAGIMARFARERLKLKKVAVLFESGNEYSIGLSDYFRREFEKRGGVVVLSLPYLKDSLDYSAQLSSVKEARPDAIYLPGYEKETGLILKQSYKMGIDLPFLGSDSWADMVPQYLGGPLHRAYEVKPWNPASPDPLTRRFVDSYKKKYGVGEELLSGSPLAYDAMMLLRDAIQRAGTRQAGTRQAGTWQAGTLDRARIREALETTQKFVGVTGPIRFDPDRNPIKGAVINRYQDSRRPQYYLTVKP